MRSPWKRQLRAAASKNSVTNRKIIQLEIKFQSVQEVWNSTLLGPYN